MVLLTSDLQSITCRMKSSGTGEHALPQPSQIGQYSI